VRIDTAAPAEHSRCEGSAAAVAILGGLVLQAKLQRTLQGRQLTARRAAWVIAASTFVLTIAGGVGAWLVDRQDFDGLGDALWWAMQTVTTVGYGDVVPEHAAGRLIGVVLMLQGIALLTVITASVTATLIEQARQRRQQPDAVLAQLEQIAARLEAIEHGMRD
jgi:voltage-gated potassium channel